MSSAGVCAEESSPACSSWEPRSRERSAPACASSSATGVPDSMRPTAKSRTETSSWPDSAARRSASRSARSRLLPIASSPVGLSSLGKASKRLATIAFWRAAGHPASTSMVDSSPRRARLAESKCSASTWPWSLAMAMDCASDISLDSCGSGCFMSSP